MVAKTIWEAWCTIPLMRTLLYIFTAQSLPLLHCPWDCSADSLYDWAASDHDTWQAAGPWAMAGRTGLPRGASCDLANDSNRASYFGTFTKWCTLLYIKTDFQVRKCKTCTMHRSQYRPKRIRRFHVPLLLSHLPIQSPRLKKAIANVLIGFHLDRCFVSNAGQ